ncbi:uncharacterized protein K444DRAFT_637629 [Hyaloscypha bicolor E]|uniref:Uncharacterized protein n=1 Tax=Hyaloscypha bicolor E TaxID=1095630 RepID=A0A2J6SHH6_9HELO|nr:uncharacterized protein K444DRAFT_637629 [Hyaloscypha bicolor E]PMD50228.1 hypothetical protein K444DRAFT_637629 [Hyaloscypha bicolor E]
MLMLVKPLTNRLGDTVEAWDRFQQNEIGYFLLDDKYLATSTQLRTCVAAVVTVFLDLKDILKKLRRLKNELLVNVHLSQEDHESKLLQMKSARQNQILVVITIAYLPLVLAANLFSTAPGVLPFTPTFGRFIVALFALGFLIAASIVSLFRWHGWTRLFVNLWINRSSRKRSSWDVERGVDDNDVETSTQHPLNLESPNAE